MKLLFDLLQGAGMGAAAGLRPFLPVLVAGALAAADLGLDFEGTEVAFLEQPAFLLAVAVALAASVLGRGRIEGGPLEPALAGLGVGLGALLAAGALDDRHDTWWPALALGAVCALLAGAVARDLLGRVRARFKSGGDTQAAGALFLYAEGAALAIAAASVLAPPLALVAVGFFVALAVKSRGRGGEKHAGLRILR